MAMSAIEIHHALQAIVIYMIMAVVDRDADTPRRGARLVQTAGVSVVKIPPVLPPKSTSRDP